MEVRHERSGRKGRFVWLCSDEPFAEMRYTVVGKRVIVDHIEVDDRLRGTGIADRLAAGAVEWARWDTARLTSRRRN
jgi:predicted GNAT family acetyltransferase